jgi:hypothetical protein
MPLPLSCISTSEHPISSLKFHMQTPNHVPCPLLVVPAHHPGTSPRKTATPPHLGRRHALGALLRHLPTDQHVQEIDHR